MYTIPLDAYRNDFLRNNPRINVKEVSICEQFALAPQTAAAGSYTMSRETFKEVNKRTDHPTVVTKYDPKKGMYGNHHYLPDLEIKVDIFVKKTDPSRFVPCAETAATKRQALEFFRTRGYNAPFTLYHLSSILSELHAASLASEARKSETEYRKACVELQKADRKTYFEARHRPPTDFNKLVPIFFEDGKWFANYEAE